MLATTFDGIQELLLKIYLMPYKYSRGARGSGTKVALDQSVAGGPVFSDFPMALSSAFGLLWLYARGHCFTRYRALQENGPKSYPKGPILASYV